MEASIPSAPHSCPASEPPARRVIRIIRIIRSYGHTAAWHCATRKRHLPGIGASSLPSLRHPRSEFRLCSTPRSEFRLRSPTEVGIPTSLFCPKNPSPGQHRRSGSDAVLAASLPECFFTITRFAINPALGTGLPHPILRWQGLLHSILRWQQDCPGVSHKTAEAPLYSRALPHSPPGFPAASVTQRNGEDQAVSFDSV